MPTEEQVSTRMIGTGCRPRPVLIALRAQQGEPHQIAQQNQRYGLSVDL